MDNRLNQAPEFKWTYNSRTRLGQKTYPDGSFEILTGNAAETFEENATEKGDWHIGAHPKIDEDAPGSDSKA